MLDPIEYLARSFGLVLPVNNFANPLGRFGVCESCCDVYGTCSLLSDPPAMWKVTVISTGVSMFFAQTDPPTNCHWDVVCPAYTHRIKATATKVTIEEKIGLSWSYLGSGPTSGGLDSITTTNGLYLIEAIYNAGTALYGDSGASLSLVATLSDLAFTIDSCNCYDAADLNGQYEIGDLADCFVTCSGTFGCTDLCRGSSSAHCAGYAEQPSVSFRVCGSLVRNTTTLALDLSTDIELCIVHYSIEGNSCNNTATWSYTGSLSYGDGYLSDEHTFPTYTASYIQCSHFTCYLGLHPSSLVFRIV